MAGDTEGGELLQTAALPPFCGRAARGTARSTANAFDTCAPRKRLTCRIVACRPIAWGARTCRRCSHWRGSAHCTVRREKKLNEQPGMRNTSLTMFLHTYLAGMGSAFQELLM